MRHIAVLLLLSGLSAANFFLAFSPELSRRYFRFPKSASGRKVIHLSSAIVLVLCVLLLFYAFLNPRGAWLNPY